MKNLQEFEKFTNENMDIKTFKTIEVSHCAQAYGIIIEHNSGWRIVYSGDTKYCPNLIKECHGSTILIHESTFENEMSKTAQNSNHSTYDEAIITGVKMGAWRTILTHFSQRYAKGGADNKKKEMHKKETSRNEIDIYRMNNVLLAWDHFGFRLSELNELPYKSRKIMGLIVNLLKDEKNI